MSCLFEKQEEACFFFSIPRGGAQEQEDDAFVSGQDHAEENPQDAFLQRLNALNLQPKEYALHLVQDM